MAFERELDHLGANGKPNYVESPYDDEHVIGAPAARGRTQRISLLLSAF